MMTPDWAHEYFERGYEQRWGLSAPSDDVRLEARGIWNLLQLSETSRVVDVGCGHGRHALALAELGPTVLGLDASVALLSRARQLAEASRAHVDWMRSDMRQLPLCSQSADAVLIMDAFGFFETEKEHETVVVEASRILRDGGSLMLKVVNGVPMMTAFRETEREERDGVEVSISNTLTLDPPRMTQRLTVSGSRGQGSYERRQRLYRVEELQAILERSGFTVTGLFANTDGAPFDSRRSSTIWLVGRRHA
jgi:ubiquinone/menaquinone biosynthesis C-methylase UbiE